MVESKFILITPMIAEEWLKSSLGNRTISANVVNQYADSIKNGTWLNNGEAICIDEDGHLRNGHHRLWAVIKANKPQEFYVTTGLPAKDCVLYDRGRTRSTRDVFAMMGCDTWQRSPKIISLVRTWFLFIKKNNKPSDDQILAFINRNADTLQFLYQNMYRNSMGGGKPLCIKPQVLLGIFCALSSGVSKKEILEFMEALNSGLINDYSKSAVIVLRNMLLSKAYKMVDFETKKKIVNATEMAIHDYVERIPWKQARTKFVPKYSNNKIIQEL